MERTWTNAVRQICQFLQESENKINFLRKIDKDMADLGVPIEKIFSDVLNTTSQVIRASQAHFYADSGKDFILFDTTAHEVIPQRLPRHDLFVQWCLDKPELKKFAQRDPNNSLPAFKSAETLLVAPVFSLKERLFGVILLESSQPPELGHFDDPSVLDFVAGVAGQLSLTLQFRYQQANRQLLYDIMQDFFANDLKPRSCFRTLAFRIREFLPSYGPFVIKEPPEVQILTYAEGDEYLIIRGTTGEEPDITRVSVAESICGLLVSDSNKEYFKEGEDRKFFLDDPRKYPKRYKSYLGKKGGQIVKIIQTEFATPVRHNGSLISILNLESEFSDAFLKPHLEATLDLCSYLAPMLYALRSRIDRSFDQQMSIVYAIDDYLNQIAKTYRHGAASPFSGAKVQLDVMERAAKPEDKELPKRVGRLRHDIDSLKKFQDEFCKDIVGFSIYTKHSIRQLIKDAIQVFSPEALLESENIKLQLIDGEDFEIYCSLFLKQHLFNLINNALYSVRQRQKQDRRPGEITVTVREEQILSKDQEIVLNRRARISIWDNGLGVSKQDLERLCRFEPRTSIQKPPGEGSGFGLFAAKEYLTSKAIGGQIFLDSKEGSWFDVSLVLDLFNPAIHVERKRYKGE